MLYPTFIRLCDLATGHKDSSEFTMSLGWQEWMDEDDIDSSIRDLETIFELSTLDISGLRERLGISIAEMSRLYQIPQRSIENWESNSLSSREIKSYILDMIRFTIYIHEKEGDDGYVEEQD